ncbi:hypothetical protein Clacol_008118 [Clathrus columnatus]|uniref:Uncharacterized protein n=1 Tax=Clathrus columnatus TaxID=1419009 RepID=A0AAV5AGU5_9AGAM|nr:hypothetical protein Clacol_008118 [Clathrus columnatus]
MPDIKPRSESSPWTPSDPADIVIPGLDPTASINEQIDRIDQLITIKCSEISFSNNPSTSQQVDEIITPARQVYQSRIGAQPQAATVVAEFVNEDANTIKVPSQDRKSVVMPKSRLLVNDEASLSPDSDSDSPEHNEQNPLNGLLYVTQNNAQVDDLFSDDGSDSVMEMQNIDSDDSFDQDSFFSHEGNEEEETVFGGRQAGQGDRQFKLQNDLLIDGSYTGTYR